MAAEDADERISTCDDADHLSQPGGEGPGKAPSEGSDRSNDSKSPSIASVALSLSSLQEACLMTQGQSDVAEDTSLHPGRPNIFQGKSDVEEASLHEGPGEESDTSLHESKSPRKGQPDVPPASAKMDDFRGDLAGRLQRQSILEAVKILHDKVERIDKRLTNHEVAQQYRISANKDKWQQLNALDYGVKELHDGMHARDKEFQELKRKMDVQIKMRETFKKTMDATIAKLDMLVAKVQVAEVTLYTNAVPRITGTDLALAQIKEDVNKMNVLRTTELQDLRRCSKSVEGVMAKQETLGTDQRNFEASTNVRIEELLQKADNLVATRITANMESMIREIVTEQGLNTSSSARAATELQGGPHKSTGEEHAVAGNKQQHGRKHGKFGKHGGGSVWWQ